MAHVSDALVKPVHIERTPYPQNFFRMRGSMKSRGAEPGRMHRRNRILISSLTVYLKTGFSKRYYLSFPVRGRKIGLRTISRRKLSSNQSLSETSRSSRGTSFMR